MKITTTIPAQLIKDVTEFRYAFQLEVDIPFLTIQDLELHDSLLDEELKELSDAKTDVERLDAIVDIAYICVGRAVHCSAYRDDVATLIGSMIEIAEASGFNFYGAWANVHASNMSKVCKSLVVARDTRSDYIFHRGYSEIDIIATEGGYICKNAEDVTLPQGKKVLAGKVLKSIEYTPADLSEFI